MIHDDPRLRDRAPAFHDRAEAGRALAALLAPLARSGALVLAIPSGGVPVAVEAARDLQLELDVVPVSKILLPWNTESGFGAVAFDGSVWVNEIAVRDYALSEKDVAESIAAARAKVERRMSRLRGERAAPAVAGRTTILVDDGIAAGSTMRVAIDAVCRLGATQTIVAAPTGHRRSVELLAGLAHEVYCVNIRASLRFAVADAYENWHDVSEVEAEALLKEPRKGNV
ncbi:MAG: phosphoribosyltransferase [Betaproteobacteria bacterium]|nr:phosphoribosyltransferase [Betaproteobacteria bacterium]